MTVTTLKVEDSKPIPEHQLLEVINRVQQMYIGDETPQALFTHMLDTLLAATGSEYGFIGEVMTDKEQTYLRTFAISNIAWNEQTRQIYAGYERDGYIDFTNPKTLFGHTMTTGEPVIANTPNTHPKRGGTPGGHPPLKAYLGLPFFLGRRLVGMIGLANREDGYDEAIVEAMAPILQTCAQLIDGYRMERERRQALTALHQSQQELARFSTELKALFQLCPDGFVAFDEKGLLNFANPALLAMTGFSRSALMSRTQAEFSRMMARLADREATESVLPADENATVRIELVRPRPTTVTATFRRLVNDDGDHLGIAFYFRDVTHEAEVDRMKTEFLSTAAHELRTPLASIHGFADLLIHRAFDDDRRKDLLKTIHRQSTALVHMINELLDLARIEARAGKDFQLAAGDLCVGVKRCVEAIMPTLGPNHRLNLECPNEPLMAWHDPDKFGQALTNVLSNAVKYSPDGGEIALRAVRGDDGDWVGIEVADSGLGMDAEQVSRIFERFYRGDQSGAIPGTGLGMSLVKEILDIHGGRVEIDSVPGQGTRVTLMLRAGSVD